MFDLRKHYVRSKETIAFPIGLKTAVCGGKNSKIKRLRKDTKAKITIEPYDATDEEFKITVEGDESLFVCVCFVLFCVCVCGVSVSMCVCIKQNKIKK